jgi:DNA-binding transcriptional LysR family regulator
MPNPRKLLPILNALPVFEEAAKAGSFTKAAQVLGMAQPSVSRFISNLEKHLSVHLFHRRHNKISLTHEGQALFEATRRGLGHIRLAINVFEDTASTNILTMRCTHGFAHLWFMPNRASLEALVPGYQIDMQTLEHIDDFPSRPSDIEICFSTENWGQKEAQLLFDEVVYAVCSPAFATHHGLTGKEVTLEELRQLPLLVQDRGERGWMNWQSWFEHFGGEYTYSAGEYMFNIYSLTLQAAMEGKGIALAWEGLSNPYLSNGWLIKLDNMEIRTGQGYYLVFSPDNPIANKLRQWVNQISRGEC